MELLDKSMQGDFCFFDKKGNHYVVESFERIPDAGAFCEKALALAASKLGVTDTLKLHNPSKPKAEVPMVKVKLIPLLWGAFIVICALVLYIFLQQQEQQPKNYADCILKSIAGASSNAAAQVLSRACEEKFPN